MSKRRVHITNYPKRSDLALGWRLAVNFKMEITVAPSIWARFGKMWRGILGSGYLGSPRRRVWKFFVVQARDHTDWRSIQENLFQMYHYRFRIKTLIKWKLMYLGRG